MKIDDVKKAMKTKVRKNLEEIRISERKVFDKKRRSMWIRVKKDALKDAIQVLFDFQYPHLSVISGIDLEDHVELLYHFSLDYGVPQKEFLVTIAVRVPKNDLKITTITDLVPGALLSEREKQEFFGIKVVGIPDNRRVFLADDLAQAHPWIKDDEKTKHIARNTHAKKVRK